MPKYKILLVDDNGVVLDVMKRMLEANGFEVIPAEGVTDALNLIVSNKFDVLVTDLHMPNAGDGFAVVTAMRHAQPDSVNLVISGYPDVQGAMAAILLDADEVMVKPVDVEKLSELIRNRLEKVKPSSRPSKESVASILERDVSLTTQRWLSRVQKVQELTRIPLSDEERTEYVPVMTKEIVLRLREKRLMETQASDSPSAVAHGQIRYRQGYTAPMLVQESRILQVCLFETIQRNLGTVDFSLVLPDIMLIADEVDSQLTQTVDSFLKSQQGN